MILCNYITGLQISVGHRQCPIGIMVCPTQIDFSRTSCPREKNTSILCIITLLKNIKNKNKTPVLYGIYLIVNLIFLVSL